MSLIKTAANAYMKRIVNGTLSNDALKTLKPVLRSKETMLEGFKKGTQNIMNKRGITVKKMSNIDPELRVKVMQNGGYLAAGKEIRTHGNSWYERLASPVSSIFKPKGTNSDAIALRHEVDEIREAGKGKFGLIKNKKFKNNNGLVGSHETLGVLHRERQNMRRLNAHGVETDLMNKHRAKTNEYAALRNEARLSKVRKLTPNTDIQIRTLFGIGKFKGHDVTPNL